MKPTQKLGRGGAGRSTGLLQEMREDDATLENIERLVGPAHTTFTFNVDNGTVIHAKRQPDGRLLVTVHHLNGDMFNYKQNAEGNFREASARTITARTCKIGGSVNKTASEVGQTILQQMGGAGRVKVMLGVKTFKFNPDGVEFGWPNRERTKGNYVKITLDPDDTYTMEFFNASGGALRSVKKHDGVYFDGLVDLFEKQTGWYLRLGRVQMASTLIRLAREVVSSLSRHCSLYLAQDKQWYMELADREYGERRDSTTYGPFVSFEAAWKYLDHFSNPGSHNKDSSGTQPVPTKSPDGGPVVNPTKSRALGPFSW